MSQISPPIRIVLICAVAFMAAWMTVLKPKPVTAEPDGSTATTTTQAPTAQSAAGQFAQRAEAAKATAESAAAKAAGEDTAAAATGTSAATKAGTTAVATGGATAAAKPAKPAGLPTRVRTALADDKVVVLLFWTPRAADDRAVHAELAKVDRHAGKVVVQAAPVARIARFQRITRGADVAQSPTVVVVGRDRKAETLVGYVDHVSVDQLVTDALRNS
jgi:hypothetical protein